MVTVIRVNLPTALLNILQGCIFPNTGKRNKTALAFHDYIQKVPFGNP